MVRFCCEHCGGKISVQDKYIGKRGKCPECGAIVVIPTQSTVITFHCQSCDRKINVPKSYAGKEAQCPNCKDRFIIPTTDFDISPSPQSPSAQSTPSDEALTFPDVPLEYKLLNQPPARSYRPQEVFESEREYEITSPAEETASATQRHLPWQIDIFLYPTSTPGLVHLAFFIGAQLVLSFLSLMFFMGLLIFLLSILIGLYMYWYITECIRDSAAGRIRAPEAFAISGAGDMFSQWLHIAGCYLIFVGPVGLYFLWTRRMDTLFWVLLAYGVFFFPMGLLACVMFDSIRGLNPVLLLASIFSTFFQYCGLVLLVGAIALAVRFFTHMQGTEDMEQNWGSQILLETLFYGIWLYAVFIVAHVIGRFYWRNQEKLNWEV